MRWYPKTSFDKTGQLYSRISSGDLPLFVGKTQKKPHYTQKLETLIAPKKIDGLLIQGLRVDTN